MVILFTKLNKYVPLSKGTPVADSSAFLTLETPELIWNRIVRMPVKESFRASMTGVAGI